MNFIEACNSGKEFKRLNGSYFYKVIGGLLYFRDSGDGITVEDWELAKVNSTDFINATFELIEEDETVELHEVLIVGKGAYRGYTCFTVKDQIQERDFKTGRVAIINKRTFEIVEIK